ncbi:MAG: helix-turn-helix domain-containing protein [Pyrinomonadaceae bacterium]|nr:helix-turn-helix domain-containing protein [Pyrinomonadaceae bacterium]
MELTKKDVSLARTGQQTLREKLKGQSAKTNVHLTFGADKATEINLPPQAVEALSSVLQYLAEGKEVNVSPQSPELTTQQDADYLRVSRPFLVNLLDKNKIPSRKVGTHRRVQRIGLEAYKDRDDAERLKALEELTKQAQELEMGY